MKNRLIIFAAMLVGTTTIYFLLNPLVFDLLHYLRPRMIRKLSIARDYYSVISSFFTILMGSLGLTLGWFYYSDRKKFDSLAKEREHKRAYLNHFLNKFDSYDRHVRKILYKNITDQNDLNMTRTDIRFFFDSADSMLSQEGLVLGLDKDDLKLIVKVFSFVDKSNLIMNDSWENLSRSPLDSICHCYSDLIQNAREACYLKIA